MRVYNNIYVLDGAGFDSNVYIVDGELLIDAGSGEFFRETVDEMVHLGLDPRNIKTIVFTHHHFDHTGAGKMFRDYFNSDLVIHYADRKFLERGETLAETFGSRARSITPSWVVSDGDVISTKNFDFVVIHTPGHTPGHICLYEQKRKILFSGDLLFSDSLGDIEKGSDRELMLESLREVLDRNIMYLFPGHGNPKVGGIGLLIKTILKRSGYNI